MRCILINGKIKTPSVIRSSITDTAMPTRVALHHRTRYDYDRPVALGPHLIRLRPAAHTRTPINSFSLDIEPKAHFVNWLQDPFGNFLARVFFTEPTSFLDVTVDLAVEMTPLNPFDFFIEPGSDSFPFAYDPWLKKALQPYLEVNAESALLAEFVAELPGDSDQTVSLLIEINRVIAERVKYLVRMEPGVQSAEQTLELAEGSCRDSAWLLVEVLRRMGLAGRFVSGYLIQLKSVELESDGQRAVKEDVAELHAWAEVYIPGAGWIGLDPTSGLLTGEGHIPLAATPDTLGAAPITGSSQAAQSRLHNEMTVTRVQGG